MTPHHTRADLASDPLCAAIMLLIAGGYLLWYQHKHGKRITPTAIIWTLPFIASEIFVAALCVMRISDASNEALHFHTAVTFLCGLVPLLREPVLDWVDEQKASIAPGLLYLIRDALIMVVTSVLSAYIIELAWNSQGLGKIALIYFFISTVILLLIMVFLYFLGMRTGALCCLVPIACVGFGIAQYFVVQFKGAPIKPSDLLALGTAMAVGSGYKYRFTTDIINAITYTAIACALLSLIRPKRADGNLHLGLSITANVLFACIAFSIATGMFSTVKIETITGESYDRWWPLNTYNNRGFISTFTEIAQNFDIQAPSGYSDAETRTIQKQLADQYDAGYGATPQRIAAVKQYNEIHPTVITVMNETFTDLSFYQALKDAGYNGPHNFNNINDALIRGSLLVSITGGGTANSEFEYLTNDSIGFIGEDKIPYSLYNLTDVDSLTKQLSKQGYKTLAMHPNLPDNWNRQTAYKRLGFSKFLDIDAFKNCPTYHSGVTDGSTYNKILEELKKTDKPMTIHDVTMQNHGGYDPGTVPDEDLTHYAPAGLDDSVTAQMNVYLTTINKADEDLGVFLSELRQLNRPVVLVFFGDHQPSVSSAMNDQLNPGEDSFIHAQRLYNSNYFVWANYDVAGCDQVSQNETIGANELSARVLELIGAPLTDYQKALLQTRSSVPALSAINYEGADGLRYALDDKKSQYAGAIDQIKRLQYLNFARRI